MQKRFVISHPDGRRYSVTLAVFDDLYRGQGFEIEHEESEADFRGDRSAAAAAAEATAPPVEGEA